MTLYFGLPIINATAAEISSEEKNRISHRALAMKSVVNTTTNSFQIMLDFKLVPPLALYVHIPWCVKKCPYCDFNSHVHAKALPETEYVNAIIRDLEQEMPSTWGREIISIFIGGGTPSLFTPAAIDRLLSGFTFAFKH